ncbi:DNA polymerase III subunit delta [Thermogutta sp.]|uniref:DNA polymerase III subunit delta n=1 Tax=Thermogutta sp. TaxID=1962930 RepID=UPI00322024DB
MPSSVLSALEFLLQESVPESFVWVTYGDDEYLHTLTLQKLRKIWLPQPEDELNLSEFSGDDTTWADVYRELVTVSMFTTHPRVVIVTEADSFVSRYRVELEKWVSESSRRNILALSVHQWLPQTRLAKLVAEKGVVIECSFSKRKHPELVSWIKKWARQQYGLILESEATELLLESVGPICGLIDQELRKLAGLGKKSVTTEMVRELTGTWRTKTVWEIIHAALEGKTAVALSEVHRLLEAGETPLGILGMMTAMLRRYTLATHRYLHPLPGQPRVTLQGALSESGVPGFALKDEEMRLRRLGRHRAAQLVHWLRKADAAMKGSLATEPRLILERLIVVLGQPEAADGRLAPL